MVLACAVSLSCVKESNDAQPPPVTAVAVVAAKVTVADRVAALLDGGTSDREAWRGLGPEAYALLDRVIADPARAVDERSRAIGALAWLENASVQARLEALLADGEPELRKAAVKALATRGGPEAQTALEARLETEDSEEIREQIQQALARMQP